MLVLSSFLEGLLLYVILNRLWECNWVLLEINFISVFIVDLFVFLFEIKLYFIINIYWDI